MDLDGNRDQGEADLPLPPGALGHAFTSGGDKRETAPRFPARVSRGSECRKILQSLK
jgi:hypothetical protein